MISLPRLRFRQGAPTEVHLNFATHVRRGSLPSQWLSDDDDSRLTCCQVDSGSFEPGWYFLDLAFAAGEDVSATPALYPDYGLGYWEQLRIGLPALYSQKSCAIRGVVMFPHALRGLQFAPGVGVGKFEVQHFRLTQLDRLGAFAAMLSYRGGKITGRNVWQRFVSAVRTAIVSDVKTMASRMYREHAGKLLLPDDRAYRKWLITYDTIAAYASHVRDESDGPLLSILLPVYNTDERWLRACLDSVLAQTYRRWELCIADDASDRPETLALLGEYEQRDTRIRVTHRLQNGHISAASNTALEMANGEFVALLDHDDLLHPDALMEIAGAAAANPHWDLIYTDEDRLDLKGRRCNPYFKPDFNASLLVGQNCISHLGAYRTSLVRELDGFREGYEGSQDWDLALRLSNRVGATRIGHVPRVLYHWRMSETSTAGDVSVKPYARHAALRALTNHLQSMCPGAKMEELPWVPGHYRIRPSHAVRETRVSLLILGVEDLAQARACVQSLAESVGRWRDLEIFLLGCSDPANSIVEFVDQSGYSVAIKVIACDSRLGVAEACRQAELNATGDVLVFVGFNVRPVGREWLDELVLHALRADVGIVGGKVFDVYGRILHAGVVLGLKDGLDSPYRGAPSGEEGQMNRLFLAQDVSAVAFSYGVAIRKELLERFGVRDQAMPDAAYDVDICLRLREAGYRTVWTPFAEFIAYPSASFATPIEAVNALRRRWSRYFKNDPSYNPNLSMISPCGDYACPPRLPPPEI